MRAKGCRARADRQVPRRGRRDADRHPERVDVRGAARAAAARRRARRVTLPPDLTVRMPGQGDVPGIAALVAACDETYRSWAPAGWEPPPPGRELDRWRGRITDGSWWTRIASEPGERIVGLVCFTQAVVQRTLPAPEGRLPIRPIR